uniref:Uncharacterized protein n=1 Tax=Trypanosoma vivax (strain Y486) TaxID=1055687 RepID=G0U5V7_TRYVY|nr:hypothetical protein TVY486_1003110 [Trypanosoma vivax Y486]
MCCGNMVASLCRNVRIPREYCVQCLTKLLVCLVTSGMIEGYNGYQGPRQAMGQRAVCFLYTCASQFVAFVCEYVCLCCGDVKAAEVHAGMFPDPKQNHLCCS